MSGRSHPLSRRICLNSACSRAYSGMLASCSFCPRNSPVSRTSNGSGGSDPTDTRRGEWSCTYGRATGFPADGVAWLTKPFDRADMPVLTSGCSVRAKTSENRLSSPAMYRRRTHRIRPERASSSRSGVREGETTVTMAPLSRRTGTFRDATFPPPTTRTVRRDKSR